MNVSSELLTAGRLSAWQLKDREAIMLSLSTLLLANLLPFSYLAATGGRDLLLPVPKKAQGAFAALSIGLIVMVVLALSRSPANTDTAQRLLILLHLAPALLTLQLMFRLGNINPLRRFMPPQEQETRYVPKPINAQVEKIGWSDLIISAALKKELELVIRLLKDPTAAVQYGISVPKGILLEGPPGTGKTTIAKVIARNAGLSFFALRLDEVVSKWVGDSEKNLSALFAAAKKHAPAVIFIDEVESIGRARSGQSNAWSDNLLNHLLQLIDGVIESKGLYIIAATNRADLIDPALLRPGRLHKTVTIPLPNTANRRRMFELCLSKSKCANDIDLDYLALRTRGFSGADIKAVCSQAGLNAMQREAALPQDKRTALITAADMFQALAAFQQTLRCEASLNFASRHEV